MRHLLTVAFVTTLFVCFFPGTSGALEPLDAEALQDTLAELIATHPTAKRTNVALKVTDLETSEVLFDQNSDKLYTPASNLKIYTSAAALDLLGPTYTPRTSVRTVHEQGDDTHLIKPEIYELMLTSEVDSMLSMEQLAELADKTAIALNGASVKKGVVVRDWSNLPDKGPGWMWDDEPDYYNMTVTRTMVDFNTLKVDVEAGEEDWAVSATLNPPSRYPTLKNYVPSRDDSSIEVTREPFDDDVYVLGRRPAVMSSMTQRITMNNPGRWISGVFTQMLIDRGVDIPPRTDQTTAYFVLGIDESQAKPIAEIDGKTNAEAVKHFLKVSENAVGEMLLLTLAEKFGENEKVSWPSGAKVISDWLINEAGLEDGSFRLVDGSGLSRYNLISADSSIRLLAYMKNESEHFEPFFDGLPVYEVALPEQDKWGEIPTAEFDNERVFAKPGGMSGVSTISGYLQTLDGRWLAFSLLGNGYIGSSTPVRDLRNQVWAELVRYQPAAVAAE